jgi:hypothetical protein
VDLDEVTLDEARDRNEVGAATAPRCSRTHGPAGDDLVLYVITADDPDTMWSRWPTRLNAVSSVFV